MSVIIRIMPVERPVLSFESQAAWRKWLRVNHARCDGIWIRLAKKNSASVLVSYTQAVEEALCHGWIDGQCKGGDPDTWLRKFTPRRKKSMWSAINRERAESLAAAGRMHPAGLREMERAKADGRWERAYEPQSTIRTPEDFAALLRANPHAAACFKTVNSVNRYAILHRLQTARKPETRAARMRKFIAMLAENRLIYP